MERHSAAGRPGHQAEAQGIAVDIAGQHLAVQAGVLGAAEGLAVQLRGVVHGGHLHRDREAAAAALAVAERHGEAVGAREIGGRGVGEAAVAVDDDAAARRAAGQAVAHGVAIDVGGGDAVLHDLVFGAVDGGVRAGGGVVDGRDEQRERARDGVFVDATQGGATVVDDVEAQRGVGAAAGVGIGREAQASGIDVGHADDLAHGEVDAVQREAAVGRQHGEAHGRELVGAAIVGIGKAEVAAREHPGGVFGRGHAGVLAGGRVVHGGDVQGDAAGGGGSVEATEGGAAVVDDAHIEVGHRRALRVRGRRVEQPPGGEVGDGDAVARRHGHAVEREAAGGGQGVDDHGRQGMAFEVGEGEVGRGEGAGGVLGQRHRGGLAHRGVVHGRDVDLQGANDRVEVTAAQGGAAVVLHLKAQAVSSAAGEVGRRGVDQAPQGDVAGRHHVAHVHGDAIQRQRARGGQDGDAHALQGIGTGVARVAETEVGGAEDVAAIFHHGQGAILPLRRIVDVEQVDAHDLVFRPAQAVGHAHGHRVTGGQVVSQQGAVQHGQLAREAVDREASAGVVDQAVADGGSTAGRPADHRPDRSPVGALFRQVDPQCRHHQ